MKVKITQLCMTLCDPMESLRPHEVYSPWNSPGQNTGVGSLSLLQQIFRTQVAQLAKNSPAMRETGDLGLFPGLGRSPGEGKGYPLQVFAPLQSSSPILIRYHKKRKHSPHFEVVYILLEIQNEACRRDSKTFKKQLIDDFGLLSGLCWLVIKIAVHSQSWQFKYVN